MDEINGGEMKGEKKPRCHNCKHSGQQFKIDKLTHLHCFHPKYGEREGLSAWDTLMVFNDTCSDHEFKINIQIEY